jgi:hypothetical protein
MAPNIGSASLLTRAGIEISAASAVRCFALRRGSSCRSCRGRLRWCGRPLNGSGAKAVQLLRKKTREQARAYHSSILASHAQTLSVYRAVSKPVTTAMPKALATWRGNASRPGLSASSAPISPIAKPHPNFGPTMAHIPSVNSPSRLRSSGAQRVSLACRQLFSASSMSLGSAALSPCARRTARADSTRILSEKN